jgi:hypothetical protein
MPDPNKLARQMAEQQRRDRTERASRAAATERALRVALEAEIRDLARSHEADGDLPVIEPGGSVWITGPGGLMSHARHPRAAG